MGCRPHIAGVRGAVPPNCRSRWSGLHEAAADRVAGEFDAIMHAELFEDVRAMALDGLLADDQHVRDLVVGVGLGDEAEDLAE
jgi:hypothetical protein